MVWSLSSHPVLYPNPCHLLLTLVTYRRSTTLLMRVYTGVHMMSCVHIKHLISSCHVFHFICSYLHMSISCVDIFVFSYRVLISCVDNHHTCNRPPYTYRVLITPNPHPNPRVTVALVHHKSASYESIITMHSRFRGSMFHLFSLCSYHVFIY